MVHQKNCQICRSCDNSFIPSVPPNLHVPFTTLLSPESLVSYQPVQHWVQNTFQPSTQSFSKLTLPRAILDLRGKHFLFARAEFVFIDVSIYNSPLPLPERWTYSWISVFGIDSPSLIVIQELTVAKRWIEIVVKRTSALDKGPWEILSAEEVRGAELKSATTRTMKSRK